MPKRNQKSQRSNRKVVRDGQNVGRHDLRSIVRSVGVGFPRSMLVKLRYSDYQLSQTQVATAPCVWQFRLNSIFDPDITYTGHQPMYRDQLASIYSRYRVRHANVDLQVIPNTTNSAPISVTAWATRLPVSGGGVSNMQDCAERGQIGYRIATAVKPARIKMSVPIHQILGLTPAEYGVDSTFSDVGTNPTLTATLQVFASAMDSSSNAAVDMIVIIDMAVEFTGLQDVGIS